MNPFLQMGIDSQTLCLHLKKRRVLTQNTDHQNKIYALETASKTLGKVIAQSLGRAIATSQTEENREARNVVLTHSTQLAITLSKFVRKELELVVINCA